MKRLAYILLVGAATACPSGAILAQTALSTTDLSLSVGTSIVQCVPNDTQRKTLYIENPTGGPGNIGYCVAAGGGSCNPAIGSVGTSTITPGNSAWWDRGSAPVGPVYCIAASASTPVTIREGK